MLVAANNRWLSGFSPRVVLAIFMLVYSLVSFFVERATGGDWANWNHALGAMLFIWYLRRSYLERKAVVFTGLMQVYSAAGMMVSAAMISGGAFMIEIAEFGTQNGIYWVVLAYFVIGFEASVLGYRLGGVIHFGQGVRKLPWRIEKYLVLLMTGIALALSLYVLLVYRGPVLLGVDRVTFWREGVPAYLRMLPTVIIQSFFIAAFYFLWMRRKKKSFDISAMIILGYLLSGILVLGQKFSLFVIYAVTFFSILPGVFPSIKFNKSHVTAILAAIGLLAGSVLLSYQVQDKEEGFALIRIALQAQLLWSVFAEKLISIGPAEWVCFWGCGEFISGTDFISFMYLPLGRYQHYLEGGTVLSGFMPALSIITLGLFFSVFIHILVSVLLGFIQQKIVAAVSSENMILGLLIFKVYLSVVVIWFAGMQTAIPGLLLTVGLILTYRLIFPVGKSRIQNLRLA